MPSDNQAPGRSFGEALVLPDPVLVPSIIIALRRGKEGLTWNVATTRVLAAPSGLGPTPEKTRNPRYSSYNQSLSARVSPSDCAVACLSNR